MIFNKSQLLNLAVLSAICFNSCETPKNEEKNNMESKTEASFTEKDVHSFAKPEEAVVTHLDWNVSVNFDEKRITGKASLTINASPQASQLILDTKALNIESVMLGEEEAHFSLAEPVEHLGQALIIDIKPSTTTVNISYSTSEGAEALQWLGPSQTADKKSPFLFTQSQAILARSWVPIQDSPGIRFTYTAKVKVPEGLLALMSAENPTSKSKDGNYSFKMEQPIPAYLLALSVGDIEFKALGPRTGVYAEPSILDRAAYEFGELEDMVTAAETLYGPYQWERYDIIVLPPSFPFGGMENPRLTFATPTILAGDRSLTSLVAHELAHSWSGNLVTNANWNDFWLNEGFTVYFEQRIMESLYGREYSEMLASLSAEDLREEVKVMISSGKSGDSHLKLDLEGRNPDDGMTAIAYDKGYLFLRFLEEKVGRGRFDHFLQEYFKNNAFKTMTTAHFIEYLNDNLFVKNKLDIDSNIYQQWIYGPGLPENAPKPVSDRFAKVEKELDTWVSGQKKAAELLTKGWSSHEWQHFVRILPESISMAQMDELDKTFGFTETGNSEIFTVWMVQVIKHQYEAGYPSLEKFLINTGRRKFLSPLYEELMKTEEGMNRAKEIYEKARPNYHFVATSTFDPKLL